ncbi:hypothetical protein [Staphylococcus cohnii]|uniref:hypothetical protein n=1 Tax=Staphylococcus cohnii TaxID=29382 RepID=UPI00097E2014|nr:hypothetical protein [Staphylococcus cohnii]AQM40528.1 hypothetical protein BZ166_01660 [Staphylococcus cohnii]MCE5034801.1 hypothetical protein [Staphylococcus cohnii]RIM48598.1 hypothetical protein BUY22_01095 [Staphylococcus cohnii]WQJ57747.1 hypothetical protein P3T93_09900 [Staphylococcus cohnii]
MYKDVLDAFQEMSSASNKVYQIGGEIDRLSELSGTLSEKVKAYREVKDYDGANAISVILIDDIKSEIDDLFKQFHEAMEIAKQKAKKLKNVCAFYDIDIQLDKGNKIINFYKETK